MLRRSTRFKRRASSPSAPPSSLPVKQPERREPLIYLSVGPSLLPDAARRTTTSTPQRQLRSNNNNNNNNSKPNQHCRLHPRPMHLFGGAVVSFILAAQTALMPIAFLAKAEATGNSAQDQQQQQHQTGPFLVDTKYWIRDMEFGERDNWRAGLKPCTLIERIAIEQEAAVISLGDSMDALGGAGIESNIRELQLAPNGVLLLEEDTVSVGAMDPLFVQYLNQSGDCYDSTLFAGADSGAPGSHPLFAFEPHSDAMSWFNGDNWHSALNDQMGQASDLMPDSHRAPCSEDVVVFGSRQFAYWPTIMGSERAKTLAFKVNFRAAEADESLGAGAHGPNVSSWPALSLPSLRVSKLEINEHSYSQAEFDQLAALYGDQLFHFRDNRSVFGDKYKSDGRQDILLIDDSSIHLSNQDIMELCHEEAGCLCGNEHPEVMRVICSFRQPLKLEHLPCRDPIQVTGYCDPICATSLAIVMDPDKFKESFLVSDVFKHEDDFPEGYFSDHIFMMQRRVDHNRYEVVIRFMPVDDHTYEKILGREMELAQRIKRSLERSAIKSFYGIRSIGIRSSVDWRRNSRPTIMYVVFAISASVFILMFVHNDEMFSITPLSWALDLLRTRLAGGLLTSCSNHAGLERGDSFLGEPMIFDQDGSVSEMPMDHIQELDLASVSMDAGSITDSTHNLIEPES